MDSHQQGGALMSRDNEPVQEEGDRTVPSSTALVAIAAVVCVLGVGALVVISVKGGSISVSTTALTVTLNAMQ